MYHYLDFAVAVAVAVWVGWLKPYVISAIVALACASNEKCVKVTSTMCSPKRRDVSRRVNAMGSKAWHNWQHSADEASGDETQMTYLIDYLFNGKGELVGQQMDSVFFPVRKWMEPGTTLEEIVHTSTTLSSDSAMRIAKNSATI